MTRYRRNLRSVRWNLWHYGRSRHAGWFIALSRLGAQILSHRNEIEAASGDLARIEDAYKRFRELEHYALANIGSKQLRAAGAQKVFREPASGAQTESEPMPPLFLTHTQRLKRSKDAAWPAASISRDPTNPADEQS